MKSDLENETPGKSGWFGYRRTYFAAAISNRITWIRQDCRGWIWVRWNFSLLFFLISVSVMVGGTNPVQPNPWYVGLNIIQPFYGETNQFAFRSTFLFPGLEIEAGQKRFPLFVQARMQFPQRFAYLNFQLEERISGAGVAYSLNHLSYRIPYGVDPYVGVQLISRTTVFEKFELEDLKRTQPIAGQQITRRNILFSAGLRMGQERWTLGIQYDYLPSTFTIDTGEGNRLPLYNTIHLFSIKAGVRIYPGKRKGIRCPSLNKRQKRSFSF